MYNLPKGYLSYSSINLWRTSKDQFRMKYYSTEDFDINTPYTRFGKHIAETLEDKTKVKEHPVLSKLPLYPRAEYPLECTIEGVPVKGFIDSFDLRHKKIIEIKTGVAKGGKPSWDRLRVRKHDQLLLYSLCIKETLGDVHPLTKLIWLETHWTEECKEQQFGDKKFINCYPALDLTGRFEVFDREIEDWEHDRMRQLLVKTAEEISEDYTAYQQSTQ